MFSGCMQFYLDGCDVSVQNAIAFLPLRTYQISLMRHLTLLLPRTIDHLILFSGKILRIGLQSEHKHTHPRNDKYQIHDGNRMLQL